MPQAHMLHLDVLKIELATGIETVLLVDQAIVSEQHLFELLSLPHLLLSLSLLL